MPALSEEFCARHSAAPWLVSEIQWQRPFWNLIKTHQLCLCPVFPLSRTDRKPAPGSEYVNMQMKCKVSLQRKRFHMQGFELVSVSPCLYPLPRGKRVRRPGLDGLWSASPGRWRSERREPCCSDCCGGGVEKRWRQTTLWEGKQGGHQIWVGTRLMLVIRTKSVWYQLLICVKLWKHIFL